MLGTLLKGMLLTFILSFAVAYSCVYIFYPVRYFQYGDRHNMLKFCMILEFALVATSISSLLNVFKRIQKSIVLSGISFFALPTLLVLYFFRSVRIYDTLSFFYVTVVSFFTFHFLSYIYFRNRI